MKSLGLSGKWPKLCFVLVLVLATIVLSRYYRSNIVDNRLYVERSATNRPIENNSDLLEATPKILTTIKQPETTSLTKTEASPPWKPESNIRLEKILEVCGKNQITSYRRVWTMATNKDHTGRPVNCNNKMCPMVVDQTNLFFYCFIPGVASGSLKEVFLKSQNLSTSRDYEEEIAPVESAALSSALRALFHREADDAMQRVSAMYFPEYIMRRYFKIIFVRHPFERLLSAFRKMAGSTLEERQYYYSKYFSAYKPVTLKSTAEQFNYLTFKQFVHYLLNTHPVYYDELWQPFWTRCNLCQLHYDFVGKLETATQDFAYVLQAMDLDQSLAEKLSHWLRTKAERKKVNFNETVAFYRTNLDEHDIHRLYETYYLDFKLFDYEVVNFINEKNLTVIDSNVKMTDLLF